MIIRLNFIIPFVIIFFTSCGNLKTGNSNVTKIESEDNTSFILKIEGDEIARQILMDSAILGSHCEVALKEIGGKQALEIKTNAEFSDAFIDLNKLFGHNIDFENARFLSMKIYVPKDSWICALKFNFKDDAGNFGGCKEVFNNFYGYTDQWLDVVVDIQAIKQDFQNWQGNANPMANTTLVSLNPYNGHQGKNSMIYVNDIQLSKEKLPLQYHQALVDPIRFEKNIPFKMDFDNDTLLRNIMAYRGFEATAQAVEKNIAGNTTTALRIKGKDGNKHFAFLPEFDKITGEPVDFTKVEHVYFSYYLTEDSDDFDGVSLFLTTKNWDDILLDTIVYSDFQKGGWHEVSLPIADLNMEKIKGEDSVWPNVYNLRLDINYRPNQRNIEMWIDDFGWE